MKQMRCISPLSLQVKHQAYYQWVAFVLFFQGLLFYLPHLLFKMWEGGKIKNIISGLHQLILKKYAYLGPELNSRLK